MEATSPRDDETAADEVADESIPPSAEADEAVAADQSDDAAADAPTEPAADALMEHPATPGPADLAEAAEAVESADGAETGDVEVRSATAASMKTAAAPVGETGSTPADAAMPPPMQAGGTAPGKAAAANETAAGGAEPDSAPLPSSTARSPEPAVANPAAKAEVAVTPQAEAGDAPAAGQAGVRGVVEIGSLTADASAPDTAPAEVRPAAATPKGAEPLPVPRGPMAEQSIEQVVASVRHGLSGGKSRHEMTVRLDPPSLGSMRIRMEMIEGQVTATFSTSSDVTHRLMQQSMQHLRASLEQAGFSVDRLQVQRTPEVTGGQGGAFLQNESGGEGREQMQHHQREQQRRETLIRLWRAGSWSERQINLTA